nr:hypothetical protein Iba_chr03dCG5290 [Ipomoea batatas]
MASGILSDKSTMPYCPECFCCGVWTADCGLSERGERPCDCRSESVAVADWRQRRRNGICVAVDLELGSDLWTVRLRSSPMAVDGGRRNDGRRKQQFAFVDQSIGFEILGIGNLRLLQPISSTIPPMIFQQYNTKSIAMNAQLH